MSKLSVAAKAFKTLYISNKISYSSLTKAEQEGYITKQEFDEITQTKKEE